MYNKRERRGKDWEIEEERSTNFIRKIDRFLNVGGHHSKPRSRRRAPIARFEDSTGLYSVGRSRKKAEKIGRQGWKESGDSCVSYLNLFWRKESQKRSFTQTSVYSIWYFINLKWSDSLYVKWTSALSNGKYFSATIKVTALFCFLNMVSWNINDAAKCFIWLTPDRQVSWKQASPVMVSSRMISSSLT